MTSPPCARCMLLRMLLLSVPDSCDACFLLVKIKHYCTFAIIWSFADSS